MRRYLVKHGPGIDLEDLDFEALDKEIEVDKATQVAQVPTEDPLETDKGGDDAPPA